MQTQIQQAQQYSYQPITQQTQILDQRDHYHMHYQKQQIKQPQLQPEQFQTQIKSSSLALKQNEAARKLNQKAELFPHQTAYSRSYSPELLETKYTSQNDFNYLNHQNFPVPTNPQITPKQTMTLNCLHQQQQPQKKIVQRSYSPELLEPQFTGQHDINYMNNLNLQNFPVQNNQNLLPKYPQNPPSQPHQQPKKMAYSSTNKENYKIQQMNENPSKQTLENYKIQQQKFVQLQQNQQQNKVQNKKNVQNIENQALTQEIGCNITQDQKKVLKKYVKQLQQKLNQFEQKQHSVNQLLSHTQHQLVEQKTENKVLQGQITCMQKEIQLEKQEKKVIHERYLFRINELQDIIYKNRKQQMCGGQSPSQSILQNQPLEVIRQPLVDIPSNTITTSTSNKKINGINSPRSQILVQEESDIYQKEEKPMEMIEMKTFQQFPQYVEKLSDSQYL